MKVLKSIAAIFVLLCVIFVVASIFTSPDNDTATTEATKTHPKQQPRVRVNCDHGTSISGRFFVKGREINFRSGPGTNYSPVINEKATKVLGKTEYRTLWPSMVLEGHCETDKWLQASIIEADGGPVNWEKGWVHKQFVTGIASADVQSGLLWDIENEKDFTVEEKALVKRGALKVLKDEPNCAKIIFGDRTRLTQKGAYYVTCVAKSDGQHFTVEFTKRDVEIGKTLGVPKPYPEEISRRDCERAIEARARHPSTLNIHQIMGYATKVHNNGNRTVIQTFSAKNSFGLQINYRARCLISPDGSLEIAVNEER